MFVVCRWYAECMSMYDTDHSFRAKQDTAYGDRGEYETSVASVVESKLARARAMDAEAWSPEYVEDPIHCDLRL